MKRTAFSCVLLALVVVPVLASSRSVQASSKRSQDQEQALVQAHKTWSQQTYDRRLALMERRQRCVDAAQWLFSCFVFGTQAWSLSYLR